jgi:hypothetical protein
MFVQLADRSQFRRIRVRVGAVLGCRLFPIIAPEPVRRKMKKRYWLNDYAKC